MKTTKLLVTASFAVLSCLPAMAKTVTIYDSSNEQLGVAENVSKLAFSDTQMTITNDEGTTQWDYVDFAYLKFSGASGVMEVSNTGVRTYIDGANTLHIDAPSAITHVAIYSIQGSMVAEFAPNATSFSRSMAEQPSGIYIVKTTAGEKQATVKIIKK